MGERGSASTVSITVAMSLNAFFLLSISRAASTTWCTPIAAASSILAHSHHLHKTLMPKRTYP
eukprot:26897-Eustigmatos_ZCMA.PRE.1